MKKILILSLIVWYALGCGASAPVPTDTPLPTPTSTPVPTPTSLPPTPTTMPRNMTNVEYFDGRRLDVYRPEVGNGPFPTVLVFHGYGGTKGAYTWLGEALSAAGYAVVIPNWSPLWLASENGLCSLAWVQANAATYGFDTQHIAAIGHSGGGSLAAFMAAIDDPGEFLADCPYTPLLPGVLKGVITYGGSFLTQEWYLSAGTGLFEFVMGVLKIPPDEGESIRQTLLDTPPELWLTIAKFDQPGTHFIHSLPPGWIDGSEPPHLLIHGAEDEQVPPLESQAFAQQLQTAGVEVQVKVIPGAGHALETYLPGYDAFWDATLPFLRQVLE